MRNASTHHRGFTVPEVLAVVAVITIILSILLPSLSKSKLAATDAICKNNLHQLHIAYTNRNVDVKQRSKGVLAAYGWQAGLLPYLGNDNEVYFCTDEAESVSNTNNSANDVYLKVFNNYPSGYLYDMSMVAGPLCRQIDKTTSDGQIDSLWSAYPSIATTIKNYRGQLPDENSYLLCFEDLRPDGGDKDYEDVIFMVTEEPDGVTIKFLYDGAGYKFDLVSRDGTVVWANMDNGGTTKPGATVKIDGSPTSYGMTDQVQKRFYGGKNVIFMLDYSRTVANCAGTSGFDPWNDWLRPDGIEKFARHWNKANVMFFDGGVRLLDPVTIKPTIAQNRIDYWIP